MRVVVTPEAAAFIESHGGVAYVKSHHQKCCHGTLQVLNVTTEAPRDALDYPLATGERADVRYWRPPYWQPSPEDEGETSGPKELALELRGRRRPHLVAFWDGCAFKP